MTSEIDRSAVRVRIPPIASTSDTARPPFSALVIPVAVALVLWASTGSMLSLAIAAITPLVLVAGYVHSRTVLRKKRRSYAREHERVVEEARSRARAELDEYAHTLRAKYPLAQDYRVCAPATTYLAGQSRHVNLGMVSSDDSITVEAETEADREIGGRIAAQVSAGVQLPCVVGAEDGVVVRGASAHTVGVVRALIVQLLGRGAEMTDIRIEGCTIPGLNDTNAHVAVDGAPQARIAVVDVHQSSPVGYRSLLDLTTSCSTVQVDPAVSARTIRVDSLGVAEFGIALARIARVRAPSSLGELPERVDADEITGPDAEVADVFAHDSPSHPPDARGSVRRRDTLSVQIGVGRAGCVSVDLLRQGPHALVAGSTGSGKSEFLITWLLAMAAKESPERLAFLLVDYKGGATFGRVSELVHVAGFVTDLEPDDTERGLHALRAELRRRERILREHFTSDWQALPPSVLLPRLVIVVDECAALFALHESMRDLFVDIAARGRSLGVHVILCTQRPAGVFTEALRVNCLLRVCLRLPSDQDRTLMVGTSAGAARRATPPGRALIATDEAVDEVQTALVSEPATRVAALNSHWRECVRPDRLWLNPLPTFLPLSSLQGSLSEPVLDPPRGLMLGRADHPETQSQPVVRFDPSKDGALCVVGAAQSGKTNALELIASQCDATIVASGDVEAAWDAVDPMDRRPLLIDDVDVFTSLIPDDMFVWWLDHLCTIIRRANDDHRLIAFTSGRMNFGGSALSGVMRSRILLRQASVQEHTVVGLPPSQYRDQAAPGSGWWRGHRIQLAIPSASVQQTRASVQSVTADWMRRHRTVVVSGAPWLLADDLGLARDQFVEPGITSPIDGQIVVGEPQAWLSQPRVFAGARAEGCVLFHRCSVADFRLLTRSRTLPPLLGASPDRAWLLRTEGTVLRVSMSA